MSQSEKKLTVSQKKELQKLKIKEILQGSLGDKIPDGMYHSDIKKLIEKYREDRKDISSPGEKEEIHHLLVSNQVELNKYLKEVFQ